MPLGIDATLRYALNNWTQPLKRLRARERHAVQHAHRAGPAAGADRQPRAGLDPGGGAAGEGRRTSSTSSSPGTCGEHAFSSTDAQFQRDVAAYNQAREAAGGKSPDEVLRR